jgi:type IV pilus assembly protein PilQ
MKKNTILAFIIGLLVLPLSAYGLSIKTVDFMNVENKSRLQIGLDGQASYDVNRVGNSVVLKINKARIPSHLARPFITSEFVTAVEQILPRQDREDVVFAVAMKEMTPYFVSQDNNLLIMDFDIPAGIKDAMQQASSVNLAQTAFTPGKAEGPAALASTYVKGLSPAPSMESTIIDTDRSPKYKGERITLDFQNADIHNILRIIADVSGLNIVTSDEVKGTVTIRLKDVPWDQALDVVLEGKDLDKMAIGNVVRIAPADKIKQAQERQLSSKKTQEQLEPLVTSVIPVNFAKASEISNTIKGKEVGLLSERGNITAENRTNVLIVKDIRKSVDEINAMVKRLDQPTPQVLISARIVQADTTFTRGLGVMWGGSYRSQSGSHQFGLSGVNTGSAWNLFDTSTTPGSNANWSSTVVPSPSMAVNFPQNQAAGFGITVGRLGSTAPSSIEARHRRIQGSINVLSRTKSHHGQQEGHHPPGEKYPYIVRDDEGPLSTVLKDIRMYERGPPGSPLTEREHGGQRSAELPGSIKNQLGTPHRQPRGCDRGPGEERRDQRHRRGSSRKMLGDSSKCPVPGRLPVIDDTFQGINE